MTHSPLGDAVDPCRAISWPSALLQPRSELTLRPDPESADAVFLVDDDASVRRGLSRLLKTHGYDVRAFPSAVDFLQALSGDEAGCVILDLDMPDINGIEAQRRLANAAATLPVIFLTGRGTVRDCSEALKAGAVDFLEKPVDENVLCMTIEIARKRGTEDRQRAAERAEAEALVARLTARETDVFQLVPRGFTNPEISEFLNISKETTKVHRARVMRKLEASSAPDLVLLAQLTGHD